MSIRLALLLLPALALAQSYSPRVDSNARLEPRGVLMHGAGQDSAAFAAYQSALPAGRQPIVYMHYIGLKDLQPDWADDLRANLLNDPNQFLIPQIGLSMTQDGTPSAHYEQAVAAGTYDAQIGHLITGLRRLGLPVYLRIGYEFNGVAWNGYAPDSYKQAFRRITDRLRAAPELEVAAVWCAAIDGVRNFFDYYPGDDVVDWFGIDIFSASHFADPDVSAFLTAATGKSKPVMLGETTPRRVGANQLNSWTTWYDPFFNWLRTSSSVKQFNYINWNWAELSRQLNQPNWADWGDARLETSAATAVRGQYSAAINDPVLAHARSETAFRQLLNYHDTAAPPAPGSLTAAGTGGGAIVGWNPVDDPSGIARYYIYRDGKLVDFALQPPAFDRSLAPGTSTYEVAAMDRAGNLGPRSTPRAVTLPSVERIVNGGFESGLSPWRFNTFDAGAAATAGIDASSPLPNGASVRVSITRSTGTDWHIQLRQFVQLTAGRTYTIRLRARASQNATAGVYLQQVADPFAIYFHQAAALTPVAATYSFTYLAITSEQTALSFFLGAVPAGTTIWFDDVFLEEARTPAFPANGIVNGGSFSAVNPIAPNAFFSVFGSDLADLTGGWDNAFLNRNAPTKLNNVRVLVNDREAFIAFTSPGQINALAPDGVTPGPATVVIETNGIRSAAAGTTASAISPGLFRFSPQNFRYLASSANDGSANIAPADLFGAPPANGLPVRPARPGEFVVIYATGLGPTNPAVPVGQLPAPAGYPITGVSSVRFGTATLMPAYTGLSQFAGVYQIVFQVPQVADGDYEVALTVNGVTAPAAPVQTFLAVRK